MHLPKTRLTQPEEGHEGDLGRPLVFTKMADIEESIISEHAKTVN